jgi:superfamily II DNA or RNA helicase
VGTHAAGKKDRLESKDILVITRNSAHNLQLNGDHSRNLLVADEVHGLGAPTFSKGLSHAFGYRLGLTATLERSDDGVGQMILPYFESKVFTLGYQRAQAEGAIAPFDIAMIPVRLGRAARIEYADLGKQISDTRRLLIRRYGLPAEPYDEFMAELGRAAEDDAHPGSWAARKYHKAVTERLDLVGASSPQKRHVLNKLVPALDATSRALVFTLFIKDADSISGQLVERGVRSESVHSNGDRGERQRILSRFEQGKTQTLVATKVLDEGVDVPEADLGVVMAAFRTRRTMIQRRRSSGPLRNRLHGGHD